MYALTIVGGRGERLRPITDDIPKPMVPIDGRPLVEYQVAWMRDQGVTDVVFLCGYKGEKIKAHFGDGEWMGVRAHYSFEDQPLGRGGAIRKGLSMVPQDEETVLVTNGDHITTQPLTELAARHCEKGVQATIMLVPYPSQFGVVDVGEDDLVQDFVEKGSLPLWINAGVYLFSRSIEGLLPEVGDHETTTFPELVKDRQLAALKSRAVWLTVDGPKDLKEVAERLKKEGIA